MSVLFIGKRNDFYCEKAREFISCQFPDAKIVLGKRRDLFPYDAMSWQGDYLISYLSPWVIPEYLLKRAKIAAINFHPGPPEYPGIGCTNFAIYDAVKTFGITCHHMAPQVDTGKLISVRRFPVFENDSVYSLTQRCYAHILSLFYDLMSDVMRGQTLPSTDEYWTRKPYKRSELNDLCRLTSGMSQEEIQRRIRAVSYPGMPGAYIDIAGQRFVLEEEPSS